MRELQNVIERAVILSAGPVLKLGADLLPIDEVSSVEPEAPVVRGETLLTLEEAERRHIQSILAHTNGVVEGSEGAARILAPPEHAAQPDEEAGSAHPPRNVVGATRERRRRSLFNYEMS